MTGPLLTTRQVAEMLSVSPATVLRRWRAGELPGYRLGSNVLRFDAGEVDAWLAEHRGPGAGSNSRGRRALPRDAGPRRA
jgi:excisionase family DNA binding protein